MSPTQGEGKQALQPKSGQAFRSKGNMVGGASKLNDAARNKRTDTPHPTTTTPLWKVNVPGQKLGVVVAIFQIQRG